MISDSTHVSPDGFLRLVIRAAEGDVTIGFEGFSWHTHADILAAVYGMSQEAAVAHQVQQLLDTAGVLHNVGNALNSVNVSARLTTERLRGLHGVCWPYHDSAGLVGAVLPRLLCAPAGACLLGLVQVAAAAGAVAGAEAVTDGVWVCSGSERLPAAAESHTAEERQDSLSSSRP